MNSLQEESAALLSQMFAQQLAGNQSFAQGAPTKPPSMGTFEGQNGQGGEGRGAGGARTSAPNPFANLTGMPFQALQETGQNTSRTVIVRMISRLKRVLMHS